MKIEWMPIAVAGGPTIALLMATIWFELVKPRLERRRRMLRRLGVERSHSGPNAKLTDMYRKYKEVNQPHGKQNVCG